LKASQFSRNNCAEKLRHPTTRLGSVREKPGVSRSEIGQVPCKQPLSKNKIAEKPVVRAIFARTIFKNIE
jgi:hypothetical protein